MRRNNLQVLHLLSSTGVHGAETMTLELGRQLHLVGARPHLALLQTTGSANEEIARRAATWAASCTVLPCQGKLDFATISALQALLEQHQIDILHCHGYKPDLYGRLACWRSHRPLVATCHNWLGKSLSMRFYAALDKRLLAGFDAVVGVSAPVQAELLRTVAASKVERIANGIDPMRFASTTTCSDARQVLALPQRPTLGFIGRLTIEKGALDLIQAFARVKAAGLAAQLLLVGAGTDRALCEAEAARLGLASDIIFTGERHDVPALYAAMDALVLPSHQEGFPMVLLEAMAAQVPIVATAVGDIAYMLDEGRAGYLVPIRQVDALAHALIRLLSSTQEAQQLAQAAYQRLIEKFSSVTMAQQYLKLYQRVLAARAAS